MYRYCSHRDEKFRVVHYLHQDELVEDMDINVPIIYPTLDNKQVKFHSHMIEVEGNIKNQPITILIDSGASRIYLDPRMVKKVSITKNKTWKTLVGTTSYRRKNENYRNS
jgi:hypothetical protein